MTEPQAKPAPAHVSAGEAEASMTQTGRTCPVCKGWRILSGQLLGRLNERASIQCNECGGIGQVPAEGDLAAWRRSAQGLIDDPNIGVSETISKLNIHLAAMPQPAEPDVNAELLAALRQIRTQAEAARTGNNVIDNIWVIAQGALIQRAEAQR